MMDLEEQYEGVTDRETFLAFVKVLIADREAEVAKEGRSPNVIWSSGADGWEHRTIENYLDAAVAWSEDSHGLPKEASWKAFALFLLRGKSYE